MAPDQAAPVPAGWYPDPYEASELRWWDGQNWTDSVHPPVAPEPPAPAAPPAPVAPVYTEPAYAEPTHVEPSPVEPTRIEPTHVEPPVEQPPTSPAPPIQLPPAQEQAPYTQAPAAQAPESAPPAFPPHQGQVPSQERAQPAPESFMTPPSTPPLVEPPVQESAPGTSLPSRRELRARASEEPQSPNSASPESGPTPTSAPTVAVPDSAAPTAFDWLNVGDNRPLGATQPADSPADLAQMPAPVASPAPNSGATEPQDTPEVSSDTGAFGLFGAPESSPGPVAASGAWAQDSVATDTAASERALPTTTRKSTVAGWLIALSPLIGSFLVVGGVKGAENYPRYVPFDIEWWMLAGGIVAILYIAVLILAIADRSKLDWSGYNRAAHWLWAALSAPVYLLVRTIAVKRETGRNSVLLWMWLLSAAMVAGGWFAAQTFAPDLIDGYALPFL